MKWLVLEGRASLGAEAARARELDVNSSLELKSERALPLDLGRTMRFFQTYNGIPIRNAEVNINENVEGQVEGLGGSAVYDIKPQAKSLMGPTRPVVIIDANTGAPVYYYENIKFTEIGTGPGKKDVSTFLPGLSWI